MTEGKTYEGSCLCGSVKYEIDGPLRPIVGCHCVQCRKTSGHHVAATQGHADGLRFLSDDALSWYGSSAGAERGFCANCGSSLFWRRLDSDQVSIFAGTLDGEHGLKMVCHILADTPGAHYEITDDLPQIDQADLASMVPEMEGS